MTSHLRCQDVLVNFGGVIACDHVTLNIDEGKIVGLIGPNGAGKTTLFNVLSRFQDCSEGQVCYRDQVINPKNPHEMIGLGLARTFQNINLFANQTTMDNILIGTHHLNGNPFSNMFWMPSARRNEAAQIDRAVEIAEMLRIEHELDNLVSNLPYGYQNRVELARALASQPDIILLDEPVAGCNDEESAELTDIIRHINRDLGITIFLVEHDMSVVMSLCDYIYVINFGANLAEGTAAEVQTNPEVITAYLGEDI